MSNSTLIAIMNMNVILSPQMKVNYERCCCFGDGKCGPYKRLKPEIDEVVDVDKLDANVDQHFINLKVL